MTEYPPPPPGNYPPPPPGNYPPPGPGEPVTRPRCDKIVKILATNGTGRLRLSAISLDDAKKFAIWGAIAGVIFGVIYGIFTVAVGASAFS